MKQSINEVKRMQELAGIPEEGSMSVAQAFEKAGINLQAPCVTVDDEIRVKKFQNAAAVLTQLTKRAKGGTVTYSFPEDVHSDELMGTPDEDVQATQGLDFKLMVDIMDSGFVEIWQ